MKVSLFGAIGVMILSGIQCSAGTLMFSSVDYPGASNTLALGINDSGKIVGNYQTDSGHGFLKDGMNFISIDYPGLASTASGINDSGKIVGFAGDHGFLLSGGLFTTVDFPGAVSTAATAINNSGQIVGYYLAAQGGGFLLSGGVFTTIIGQARGINNGGHIVGFYPAAGTNHGFLLSGAAFTPLDFPGAVSTEAYGINDSVQIVGNYFDGAGILHGFLKDGTNFISIDYPGAFSTQAFGINDSGQIVGFYVHAQDNTTAF